MKVKVNEKGVVNPRKFLKDIKEVDIRRRNGVIVVVPLVAKDPIFNIGKNPVRLGITDASENLDKYVYTGE